MQKLLESTTAYKIFAGDLAANKLSHAYMLHFPDGRNLRAALKLFALKFFGAEKDAVLAKRINGENFVDLRIYPEDGKKITADGVAEIIGDCALRPVEGARKLYVICGFDTASPLVQNKLLKTLEEPLEGVHFLLGACSLAPVLDTVKSRVKTLEIAPFSERQIFEALERQGHSELNAAAAKSANGVLGAAENMVGGGWFQGVADAAAEICASLNEGDIGEVAARHGDTKYKEELLSEMQRLYFTALTEGTGPANGLSKPALVYAVESVTRALSDLKFNAYFQGLLYDFMLGVVKFNRRAGREKN